MPRRPTIHDPLYLPDAEIARRVSMGALEWAAVAVVLERSGLPRKDPLFHNMRCWPVVWEFLYRRAGGGARCDSSSDDDGGLIVNLEALRSKKRRRTGIQG